MLPSDDKISKLFLGYIGWKAGYLSCDLRNLIVENGNVL